MPELEAEALAPAEVPEPAADDARELVLAPDVAALEVEAPAGEVEVVAPAALVVVPVVAPAVVESVAPDVEEPDAPDVELAQSVEPPVCTVTGAVCFTAPVWSRTLKTRAVP